MFLQNQFFFFRIYFKVLDCMNCIVFSWNPKLEYFELNRPLYTKILCYFLIGFQFLYLCAASFVLLGLKKRDRDLSTVSLALHLLLLTSQWYCLLFRSFYTTKANELVCYMNTSILLEKRHFHSKFLYQLNPW